jgi:hypothetical protein
MRRIRRRAPIHAEPGSRTPAADGGVRVAAIPKRLEEGGHSGRLDHVAKLGQQIPDVKHPVLELQFSAKMEPKMSQIVLD